MEEIKEKLTNIINKIDDEQLVTGKVLKDTIQSIIESYELAYQERSVNTSKYYKLELLRMNLGLKP